MSISRLIKIFFFVAAAALIYQSCTDAVDDVLPNEKEGKASYLGDESCKSCHATEYQKWTESHHYRAMEIPADTSVEGDFNNATFSADGVDYFFFKANDKFKVAILDAGKTDTFSVKYTFGFTPLQQYLVETDKGKIQTLRASWDTDKKVWFHQYAGEKFAKNDWFHFTNQSANWNGMCAHCHSTNVVKDFKPEDDTYHTTFDVINVSCESCHGAGSNHVALAEAKTYSPEKTGFPDFGKGNIAQVNMCGGCHSRRGQYHDAVQPGEDFHDAFNLSWIDERNYHVDGQIREEDYVLASFMSSKMFHKGVACNNCHDNHSMKLKLEGNALCMQCHDPKLNTPEHHFHKVDTKGANCVDCHMTGKTYMGNDFRRDHSFRIPRPDQSEKYGTPNACISCHTEKSNQWAASTIEKFYKKKPNAHFSDYLLSGWEDGNVQSLVFLANDTSAPAISRGTAIYYLGQLDLNEVYTNLKNWAIDEEVLVRKSAQQSIHDFPMEQRIVFAAPALKDKTLAVRLEAYSNLIDVAQADLPPAYQGDYFKVAKEYQTYLRYSADFPEGQGQMGQYYYQKGEYEAAIAAFKKGLKIDSLRSELRLNLAILYNVSGNNEKGLIQFNRLIAQEPSHRVYYLRALLLGEMNRLDESVADLKEAIALNNNISGYYYNLVLLQNQQGKKNIAFNTWKEAVLRFPNDSRLQQLRNIFQ